MQRILIGMVVSTLILLVLTFNWGYETQQNLEYYNTYVENQLQRMFYNMVTDVENIQSNLSKVLVTGSPKQNVMILTDLMYKSYDAQEKLTQLPIRHNDVSKTQKFLSQVGDLSMALARKNLEGTPLSSDDISKIEELHNYSNYLAENLLKLQNQLTEDGNRIRELITPERRGLEETNENLLNTSFINVEERMQNYPELIYDGPFSEHIKDVKPKLQGEEVSDKEAIRIAEGFLEDGKKYTGTIISETDNTKLSSYIIELKYENMPEDSSITLAVTKIGGKPLWMLNTTPVGDEEIDREKAIAIASDFLRKKGFQNMEATYFEEYDGQVVINFAYSEDGIIVYSDLIKVKVALDNGDIKGFEAEGYLSNHHKRIIEKPKITEEEARDNISLRANIEKSRLAIIPTEWRKEILCYEFMVKYKEDTFLIYINAINGEEEKVLQMLIKEDGVFTM